MLGKVRWKLVEVVGQLDLAAKRAERVRNGTTARQRHQTRDGPTGALDDDLLATFGEVHQPRQLALGLMHSDADHAHTLART